jgi:DNA-binding MarR family transcriptional regulator
MNQTATQLALGAGINSLNHLHIVELVAEHGPLTMVALAELAGVSTAAVTGAVDVLEKLALVERNAVPGDRRKTHVILTDWKGRELINAMRAAGAAADLATAAAAV